MFGSKKDKFYSDRQDSERSLISESVSIEGTVTSSGAIDIAGLVKGPVNSKEVIIKDTGSVTGSIESDRCEIYGHMEGKVNAQQIVVGSTGVIKGDLVFGDTLRTEEGADIEGYIKKGNSLSRDEGKIKDILFAGGDNKDDKKPKKNGKPAVVA